MIRKAITSTAAMVLLTSLGFAMLTAAQEHKKEHARYKLIDRFMDEDSTSALDGGDGGNDLYRLGVRSSASACCTGKSCAHP